jgi:hypothetical protein
MMQHTPGPWKCWNAYTLNGLVHLTRIGPEGDETAGICAPYGTDMTGKAEDLQLAAAAPEMLEVCQKDRLDLLQSLITEAVRHAAAVGDGNTNAVLSCCAELQQFHDDLESAIAKAKGTQS